MKYSLIIFLLLISMLMLSSCDQKSTTDNPTGTDGTATSQIFLVWAEHFTVHSYYTALAKTNSDSTATSAYGVVLADKMPQFNHAKFNDYIYTGYQIYPGYIGFGDEFSRVERHPDYGLQSPLNFEGKTSIGTVSGSVALPDTIVSVHTSVTGQLPKGQSFTLSWSGSNADFYDINGEYEWIDAAQNWQYMDLDTMISGSSVSYDGSLFQYDGYIRIYNITPTNGPLPTVGAQANLSGDGSGFMFYGNRTKNIVDITVNVGNSLQYNALTKTPAHRNTHDSAAKLAKVRAMLGF